MRTDKERKEMVKRVQATHKKWPTFASLPENKDKTAVGVKAKGDPNREIVYIETLYEACRDGTPIGRSGDYIIIDEEA